MADLNLKLDTPAPDLKAQLNYIEEVLEAIKTTDGTIAIDRSKDLSCMQEVYKTLVAAQQQEEADKRRQARLLSNLNNDYSLESCIEFVRMRRTDLTESLKHTSSRYLYHATSEEVKMLGSVEENLKTMNVICARMVEELIKIPGNQPTSEEVNHG